MTMQEELEYLRNELKSLKQVKEKIVNSDDSLEELKDEAIVVKDELKEQIIEIYDHVKDDFKDVSPVTIGAIFLAGVLFDRMISPK